MGLGCLFERISRLRVKEQQVGRHHSHKAGHSEQRIAKDFQSHEAIQFRRNANGQGQNVNVCSCNVL